MNKWSKVRWAKEVYLALLPAGPLGYLLYHCERDLPFFSRFYERLDVEVPDHLLDMVESEVDVVKDVKKAKIKVSLTDRLNGRVFGSFFLNSGTELQLPLRLALRDADDAKKIGSILDVDIGIKKTVTAFDINSENGESLVSKMQLSDDARRYAIRRELLSAQSGKRFAVPMVLWCIGFGLGYGLLMVTIPVIGSLASFLAASSIGFLVFYKLYSMFCAFITFELDREACIGSESYLKGAVEYFTSSMKLCRLMRRLIGKVAFECITENGDCKSDPVPYSGRLKAIKELTKR